MCACVSVRTRATRKKKVVSPPSPRPPSTAKGQRYVMQCSVGDAAHAIGVHVGRHRLGQREAVGYALESGRELDVDRWVARAQRHDRRAEPDAAVAARRGAQGLDLMRVPCGRDGRSRAQRARRHTALSAAWRSVGWVCTLFYFILFLFIFGVYIISKL